MVDCDLEARRLKKFPHDALHEIFFREVAPVCGPNFLTPVPSVWQGFDLSELKLETDDLLARRRKSTARRFLCEVNVTFYRIWFRGVWKDGEATLERNAATPGAKRGVVRPISNRDVARTIIL
ncbi:hypothetical protein [Burkholderia ubonensis]|uniref:DUF7079 family protein n=1 Tax=Burkholderia ubonensis TaxID=101571 RepID=UPI0012FAC90C|nr:hypothetical protein [Burkholderia ubonensis]